MKQTLFRLKKAVKWSRKQVNSMNTIMVKRHKNSEQQEMNNKIKVQKLKVGQKP